MMVVDTSALLSIVYEEPDADRFEEALARSHETWLSWFNLHEGRCAALRGRGDIGVSALNQLVEQAGIRLAPFDAASASLAFEAYEKFRRGRYGLNLGDTVAYALAKSLGAPLLFKGRDFARTDVTPAL